MQGHITQPEGEIINLHAYGVDRTGEQPADPAILNAIRNLGAAGGSIYLPEGTYRITQTIELPSNVWIVGAGSAKTSILLDLTGSGHGFLAKGSVSKDEIGLKNCGHVGANKLEPVSGTFEPGDLIQVTQKLNAPITSDWAKESIGQLIRIQSVENGVITLERPLRFDAHVSDEAYISKVDPVEHCGILNLSIKRTDVSSTQTDNIHFEYTSGAVVYGVNSQLTNFAHINNVFAHETYVYGCHFSESHDYGNGGKGYGVVLSFSSSDCVVENNIFNTLRHSILFQAGSNGNVIGYNYSSNAHWTGTSFPASFAGDVVMHGNYPFFNLVEGNILQNLVIDNSHGKNGPNNTFLRNRVEHAGIYMNTSPASDAQSFIGNEVTGTGTESNGFFSFPKGLYSLAGENHFEYANNVGGTLLPSAQQVDVSSMYYSVKPTFIQGTWPSIGYPNDVNSQTIPAKERMKEEVTTIKYPFDNPFEVSIIQFKLQTHNDIAELSWKVTQTNTCRQVEVFRTTNHQNPDQIALLECGTSSNGQLYYQTDYQFGDIALQSDQIGYFVQLSLEDGTTLKSETLYAEGQMASAFVNPRSRLIRYNQSDVDEVAVFDSQGREVYRSSNDQQEFTLPAHIQTGIYYLNFRYTNNTERRQKIFIAAQ